MSEEWHGYVETWCTTHRLVAQTAMPWLRNSPSYAKARAQFDRKPRASDRVLNNLLRKAAIDQGLMKG